MQRFLLAFCCFVAYFCLFSNTTHPSLFSKFIIIIIIVIILLLLTLIVVVREAILAFLCNCHESVYIMHVKELLERFYLTKQTEDD